MSRDLRRRCVPGPVLMLPVAAILAMSICQISNYTRYLAPVCWSVSRLSASGNRERKMLMLLELAIGDAYGAGFEYADMSMIQRHNDLTRYVKHPRHHIKPGAYTDDTQMSIAIVEAMLSAQPWTADL